MPVGTRAGCPALGCVWDEARRGLHTASSVHLLCLGHGPPAWSCPLQVQSERMPAGRRAAVTRASGSVGRSRGACSRASLRPAGRTRTESITFRASGSTASGSVMPSALLSALSDAHGRWEACSHFYLENKSPEHLASGRLCGHLSVKMGKEQCSCVNLAVGGGGWGSMILVLCALFLPPLPPPITSSAP